MTGKERQEKYRLKKISEGKKPVTVFLSEKAHSFLREGASSNYSETIDKAVLFYQSSIVIKPRNGIVLLDDRKSPKQDQPKTPKPTKKRRWPFGRNRKEIS
ncbi:MAG: hypothetical protein OMM_13040 [Candidatus Magnetoglobus multicellularis str. Araruama]|uniref:Uncharacterized protein n=1 Tax=Candidatus Magnetoglobus multicellularis str. Araruama TaxID=890399 RepID=A0A1V1NUS9_9BACT|nr:MAG: hypothetical protein OMM_13040 [Candidatus Magnetoglobus multicellularis str. Araruama]